MQRSLNLPNLITMARIAACPVISYLALAEGLTARFGAFVLFLVAGLSDLWDGYLARKRGLITDLGKLLDPLADKLLLLSTFVPFYFLSRRAGDLALIPWWGILPLWVLIVIFGRELAVTALRGYAAQRGVVISAGPSGKYKAFLQNFFSGSLLLWYPLVLLAARNGWNGALWNGWRGFHATVVGSTLLIAIVLTVYSMGVYFWGYRSLIREGRIS